MKKHEDNIIIRPFRESDAPELVEIIRLNNQFSHPDVEGEGAMKRVAACDAAIFRVAELDRRSCGLIRAVYDGSRALIHLLSVHPDVWGKGIGTKLVEAVREECRQRGAPGLSVTVTEKSAAFWEKQGFTKLPVFLMLQESIATRLNV